MNKQYLIIYDFNELFNILNEIKKDLNFNLINVSKQELFDLNIQLNNSLIVSKKEISKVQNQVILKNLPLKILILIFLKLNLTSNPILILEVTN